MIRKHLSQVLTYPVATLLILAAIITGIHLTTVFEYPPAWFDEIEILEMGRFSIFEKDPDWTLNLFPLADGSFTTPRPYFHYVCGALLEGLYRVTGGFLFGRILMLISLPCCALALFFWLKTKEISLPAIFATSLLFLVDPNATICAHWYRPDLWCTTMIFCALSLIERSRTAKRPPLRLVLAGILTATSVFVWITSVLFLPLVLLEAVQSQENTRNRIRTFVYIAFGGLFATAVFLAPLLHDITGIIEQYLSKSEISTITKRSGSPLSALAGRTSDFIKIACRSPFIWGMSASVILFTGKFRLHAALFVLLAGFILATRVYHLRMIYLMPYLFLFTADGIDRFLTSESWLMKTAGRLFVSGTAAFGILISVIALNTAGLPEKNTLPLLIKKLRVAIPEKRPNVYLLDFEHEFYYAGRNLGWRMYSTVPRDLPTKEPYAKILDSMDVIIISAMLPSLTDDQKRTLVSRGFTRTERIEMPPAAIGPIKSKLASIFYAHGYPSFEIWRRRRNSESETSSSTSTTNPRAETSPHADKCRLFSEF